MLPLSFLLAQDGLAPLFVVLRRQLPGPVLRVPGQFCGRRFLELKTVIIIRLGRRRRVYHGYVLLALLYSSTRWCAAARALRTAALSSTRGGVGGPRCACARFFESWLASKARLCALSSCFPCQVVWRCCCHRGSTSSGAGGLGGPSTPIVVPLFGRMAAPAATTVSPNSTPLFASCGGSPRRPYAPGRFVDATGADG